MNDPSHAMNPDKSLALTEAPRTRWVTVAPEGLHQRCGAAYLAAQARGFTPGHELDAWLCLVGELTHLAKD